MSLHLDLVDPVVCAPTGQEPTDIALATTIVDHPNYAGQPYNCAKLSVGRPTSSYREWWNISSEGLRALARAATCMAEEIEARQKACEVPR